MEPEVSLPRSEQPATPILSQLNPVHTHPTDSLICTLTVSFHLQLVLPT